MKAAWISLLLSAGALHAEESGKTVWYDSKGTVVAVEEAGEESQAPVRFVPQWVKREEQRDKALRGDGYRRNRGAWTDGGYIGWGWSWPARYCRSTPCLPAPCARPFGGVRVIIR